MGIANIVNTAGGGGGSSEIITHLVNSVDGAGLRLANQGYISCADVSANRFGTNDFSVEFVLSQETSAVNADIFISNFNSSNQAVDAAVIRWDVVQNDNIQLVFTNSGAAETAYNFGYDPAPDLNEPTHYLVSADRSGNAVLYRNGAEIASVSIAASGSANVGNSGQPTVIGSPVNNFGVKGNVYRFRTYSKALSSDEAKNVFDRADVPTALVSNLLLDLDCAYANPTQSTVIQDRGPNNQDGTLNGTITQTNVIKQLNSTSARIGTPAATAADGEIISSGKISANAKVNINSNGTLDWGNAADYGVLSWGGTTDAIVRGAASKNLKLGANNQNFVTINTSGNVGVGDETPTSPGGAARFVEISGTSASLVLTDSDAATWEWISAGGNLKAAKDGSDYLSIDSSGNVIVDGGGYVKIAPANTTAELRLYRDDATINASGIAIGDINFGGADADNDNAARLRVKSDGAWTASSSPTAFEFQTCPSGSESLATRLVIASTGLATFTRDAGSVIIANRTTDNGDAITVRKDNYDRLRLGTEGITFPNGAGAAPTAAAENQLDYYEEGTWTCTLGGASSVSNTTAYYTRVGDIVTVWFYSGSMTSDGSAATISGLPFTVSAAAYGGFFCFHNTYAPTANSGYFSVNTVTGNFTAANATATASSASATGRYLMFTGVYKAA